MAFANAAEKTGLKDAYKDRFLIGAAINTAIASGEHPDITEIIKRDFGSVTPENSMKWGSVRTPVGGWKWEGRPLHELRDPGTNCMPSATRLAWADAQFGVQDAKGNYIQPAELAKKMEEHITTIVGRYKGQTARLGRRQ